MKHFAVEAVDLSGQVVARDLFRYRWSARRFLRAQPTPPSYLYGEDHPAWSYRLVKL